MAVLVSQAEREVELAAEVAQAAGTPVPPRSITQEENAALALRDKLRDAYRAAADLHIATGLSEDEAESVEGVMRRARESVGKLNRLIEARKATRLDGER